MKYSGKYLPYSHQELRSRISQKMSAKRFTHVLGVEQTALKLAARYQVDLEKASIAALVHDYAKERSDEDFLLLLKNGDYPKNLEKFGNQIWHGLLGADIIAKELEITDQEILDAVRFHTTGDPQMSLLAQVIYVADYIEPNRDFPGVEEARKMAKLGLADAVKFETKKTLEYLIKQEVPIYPKTIETYNYWVAHLK